MTRSRDVSKGATRNEFIYTATATQTTFSGNDDSSNSLSYTVGQIDVFMNGARLAPADFTATNGTSVVLDSGAAAGDVIQINAFGTFSVSDVLAQRTEFDYTATAGQTTFTGADNDSQSMSYTAGRIDVYLNGSRLNQTDDYVATNGTSVVLQSGAQAGDSLVVVSHGTVNLVSNILSSDLDLNGNELVLDADGDTTITADTDDQIDIKVAGADDFAFKANKFEVQTGSNIDMNGTELILDADGDTSITADTDDQIDIKVAGSDVGKINSSGIEGANLVLLDSSTLGAAASTIDISAATIGTTYNHLKLFVVAIPTSGSAFFMRFNDSSASLLNSVSDYGEQVYRGGGTDFNDSTVSAITTVSSGGDESGRSTCVKYDIFNLRSSSLNTNVIFSASLSNDASRLFITGAGGALANEDNQGIQLSFSSGNIDTGSSYALYGVKT